MLGGEGWDPMAAVRALVRAEDAVDDAVRLLLEAEAVHWTGRGAAAYRRHLEDATDGVRRARADLRGATGVVAEQAAVRRSGLLGVAGAGAGGAFPAWPSPFRLGPAPGEPWSRSSSPSEPGWVPVSAESSPSGWGPW